MTICASGEVESDLKSCIIFVIFPACRFSYSNSERHNIFKNSKKPNLNAVQSLSIKESDYCKKIILSKDDNLDLELLNLPTIKYI